MTAAQGTVGIGTARNTTVPVTIELHNVAPDTKPGDLAGWDHVAEASLEVPSGIIVVHSTAPSYRKAPRVRVPAGTYRVRAYHGGPGTLSDDELHGDDHYRVTLWPEVARSCEVLKQFKG